jgi:inhibitor of Bruton tyrosine kinase
MSHVLWSLYWSDNVDKFRRLLAPAGYNAQVTGKSPNVPPNIGSYGTSSTSPRALAKIRKTSGYGAGSTKYGGGGFGKHEVNSRDHAGLTILLRASSSNSDNAIEFVRALLDHPAIDIYAQDPESGWNALHRSLYAGNISIARLLLEKERRDITGQNVKAAVGRVGDLIKTKDHEGNSPFDLYNSTIGERALNTVNGSDTASVGTMESDDQQSSPDSPTLVAFPRD